MTDTIALFEELRAILVRAQDQRPDRQDVIDGELDWIRFERETMHTAVNQARADRGLPLVSLAAIERVEAQAADHVDYTKKFALYWAELAQEQQ